jgi:UDP-arabinose 4-epimerase
VNNQILVTGGAGYREESGDMTQFRQKLGSCPPILPGSAGYLPIAFDNLVYGHRDLVKWGPFEEGDITDSTRLDDVMEKYQPDAVLHFAGFAYVGESVQKPDKYYRNNVGGSLTLLESMIKHRIHKIVFSSSHPSVQPIAITSRSRYRRITFNPPSILTDKAS